MIERKDLLLHANLERGLINLQTYSRPHLLSRCLESIYSMENSAKTDKMIVLQVGNLEVERLVYAYADERTEVIEVDGRHRTPLQNMNFNRWLALERGFYEQRKDWILSVEEDIELAPETLSFISQVYSTFSDNRKFRGINLGSILDKQELLDTYSLQRFGVHGCGSVLTRRTWSIAKYCGAKKTLKKYAFDGFLEGITKSGFMVTPNITLYLDSGWDSGTHNSHTGSEPHYMENRQSWVARDSKRVDKFRQFNIEIPWREDCVPYNPEEDFRYLIRAAYLVLNHSKILRPIFMIFRIMRNMFRNTLN